MFFVLPATPVARLVSAHEQHGPSVGIEDEHQPHLAATAGARPQLLQVVYLRVLDAIDKRSTECRPLVGQHIDRRGDLVIGVVVKTEDRSPPPRRAARRPRPLCQ